MRFSVITIFPDLFAGPLRYGMIRKARELGLLDVRTVDLRQFAPDRHQTVDDRPFGGGDGMVLKAEPLFAAIEAASASAPAAARRVLLSPQGRRFDQDKAIEYSLLDHVILVSGRYEGVDQRVADYGVDEEISIGDVVLSGGEFAALLIIDAVSRLIPGVVAKSGSILRDSFMDGMLDCPHYTRPADFRGWQVPEALLSGNHAEIENWRRQMALGATRRRRPELLSNPSEQDWREVSNERHR